MLKQGAISVAILGLLASCTTASLHELRSTTPKGSAHSMALAGEYLAFSEQEATQYDWVDSQYFAEKGLIAAYGKPVEPESLANWKIDRALKPEFQIARSKLEEFLTPKNKKKHPKITAKAQVSFDCWLEQQEEGWQTAQINDCKNMFYDAIDELHEVVTVKKAPVKAAPKKTMEPKREPVIRSTAYIVFFDHDEYNLTPLAKEVLNKALADVKKYPNTQILLHGHADRSGADEYNMELSERRAKEVQATLIAAGVPQKQIKYFAFGETDLRVVTDDGIREPANRRVEIFLE